MRFGVRAQLFSGFGVLLGALLISGIVSILMLRGLSGSVGSLYDDSLETTAKTGTLRRDMLLMREAILSYVLATPDRRPEVAATMADLETVIADDLAALHAEPALTGDQRADLQEVESQVAAWYEARDNGPIGKANAGDDAGAATAALYGVGGQAFQAAFAAMGAFADATMAAATRANDAAGSRASLATTLTLTILLAALLSGAVIAYWIARRIVGGVSAILNAANGIAEGDVDQRITVHTRDELGDLGRAFERAIAYLKEAAAVAAAIADGDLTTKVQPRSDRDALGLAFQAMAANLNRVVGQLAGAVDDLVGAKAQLAEAAEQTARASTEVATSIGQVAEGTQDQATAVQTTRSTMDDLVTTIAQIADGARRQAGAASEATALGGTVAQASGRVAQNAGTAATGAREAAQTAADGASMVQNTVDGITRIKQTVDAASQEIGHLGEKSAEIGRIVAVIDDIAAQTNLLALNAAIEAARAGDQGRGFAVVADEVRKLAERVAQATKEIALLVKGVQEGVDASVRAMAQGTEETETGTRIAAEAGAALQKILTAVTGVSEQITLIAGDADQLQGSVTSMADIVRNIRKIAEENTTATQSVERGAEGVQDATRQVAAVAEQNSAATEQVSASAEELSAQAQEVSASAASLAQIADALAGSVATFRLAEGATIRNSRADVAASAPLRRAA